MTCTRSTITNSLIRHFFPYIPDLPLFSSSFSWWKYVNVRSSDFFFTFVLSSKNTICVAITSLQRIHRRHFVRQHFRQQIFILVFRRRIKLASPERIHISLCFFRFWLRLQQQPMSVEQEHEYSDIKHYLCGFNTTKKKMAGWEKNGSQREYFTPLFVSIQSFGNLYVKKSFAM